MRGFQKAMHLTIACDDGNAPCFFWIVQKNPNGLLLPRDSTLMPRQLFFCPFCAGFSRPLVPSSMGRISAHLKEHCRFHSREQDDISDGKAKPNENGDSLCSCDRWPDEGVLFDILHQ